MIPYSLKILRGGRKETGTQPSPASREGWGIKIWLYFSLPYSDFSRNKSTDPPNPVLGERSHQPFALFSLPFPAEEGGDGAALGWPGPLY